MVSARCIWLGKGWGHGDSRCRVLDIHTQVVECVDAALKQLGPSISQALYFHLENKFGIKKEEILNQPEAFSKALHSIFGAGANVIERLIVQKIKDKFKLHLGSETCLAEAIQTAKNRT